MQSIQNIMAQLLQDEQYQEMYQKTVQEILNYPAIIEFLNQHESEVSGEIVCNSLSKLNEYMREHQAIAAGNPGQNIGYAPSLVLRQHYIDVVYRPTKEALQATAQREKRQLIDNRMMSKDVREATFDKVIQTPERRPLLEALNQFYEQYKQGIVRPQGVYVYGWFGVGKTYILGAFANYLMEHNVAVTMIHYPTFISELKQTFAQNTTLEALQKVQKVPVLMIDDIGAETTTEWVRDEVFTTILEYRMKESLPTFFTSNMSFEELEQHLANTRDTIDEVKAKRLMERVRYLAKPILLPGENLRHK